MNFGLISGSRSVGVTFSSGISKSLLDLSLGAELMDFFENLRRKSGCLEAGVGLPTQGLGGGSSFGGDGVTGGLSGSEVLGGGLFHQAISR